jgi:hypothetical protein
LGVRLTVAALWLATGILPVAASGQEAPRAPGLIPLGVQPWLWPGDHSGLVERDAPWLVRLAEQLASQQAPTLEGLSWKSAFEERQAGTHDNRRLINWRARASSSLGSGTLTGEVSVLAVEAPNSVGLGAEPRRWLRLALRETSGPLTLGARVESINPGLDGVSGGGSKNEREGGEAWIEGRGGPFRLRLSGGTFWDNLADDPWQPQTTKTQGGAALDVSLSSGVALTVGYQGGLAERAAGRGPGIALAAESGASAFQSATASVSCSRPSWTLAVSSTYTPSSDLQKADHGTVSLTHDVSATFHVLPDLTVTPTLSFAEDTYEWSGTRSQTTSASVSVSWTSVLEGVDLIVSGSYARNHTTQDVYDATSINAAAGLIWHPRRTRRGTNLAFEVGSYHYLDRVTPSAGYAEVYAVLTFRLATF